MIAVVVDDPLHLFTLLAIVNLIAYVFTFIRFDSRLSRLMFAINYGVVTKAMLETGIGEHHWPHETSTNLFMLICFTACFYVLSPNIWGVVFLVLGLLSIKGFADGVQEQIRNFFEHSLNWTMGTTSSSAIFAGILVFIMFMAAVSVFFSLTLVQTCALAFVYSVNAAIAYNILTLSRSGISCADESPPEECPFWLTGNNWYWILALFSFRIAWGHWLNSTWDTYVKRKWAKKHGFTRVPSDTADTATVEIIPTATDEHDNDNPGGREGQPNR